MRCQRDRTASATSSQPGEYMLRVKYIPPKNEILRSPLMLTSSLPVLICCRLATSQLSSTSPGCLQLSLLHVSHGLPALLQILPLALRELALVPFCNSVTRHCVLFCFLVYSTWPDPDREQNAEDSTLKLCRDDDDYEDGICVKTMVRPNVRSNNKIRVPYVKIRSL